MVWLMRLSCLLLWTMTAFASGEIVGRRAPGFALPDSSFRYYDPQDYRGRILLIEFMQTTCPHCAPFSKILEEVAAKYAGKVAVLSIVNPPDTHQTVSKFRSANGIKNPILVDGCGQVAGSYIQWTPQKSASFDIPRLFIVDSGGIVRRDYEHNPLTKDIFEGRGLFRELDRMLAAPGATKD